MVHYILGGVLTLKKTFLWIGLILFMLSIGLNATLLYDQKRLGDLADREEILTAAVFELQRLGYDEKDIQSITTEHDDFLLKGKAPEPYDYIVYVETTDAPNEVKVFTWADTKHSKVILEK